MRDGRVVCVGGELLGINGGGVLAVSVWVIYSLRACVRLWGATWVSRRRAPVGA